MAEVKDNSAFECPICCEPLVDMLTDGSVDTRKAWFAPARKTEHWSNQPCGHACCRNCMRTWAQTAIDDHKTVVRCPAVHCTYCLWDQDLRDLVSEEHFLRYQEHKNADYAKRVQNAMKEDPVLRKWLKKHSRPCPSCHVIVSRSEGCNVMMCVCGTRFCYACGFIECKCSNRGNRPDIWRVH